ncbi:hypothetical protein N7474_002360 [Penicillium riverlandense]|uniref:uncharacterized protein n=1 Tax=Penicillium riverlandense TaxID=1903569 RepID=UPI002546D684|nr:uncharacterized protein N7474_002360 [Penicillium riverlandense]KAJ5825222.1 hypothetical protein N7474_002360 [Penicillium riverlandense]
MATLPVTLPVCREFSSRERLEAHIELMRKFKCILNDVEYPSRHADRFPPPPPGVSGPEEEARWRVQCLLMSAEVRYSMYLQSLERWIASHGLQSPKDEWPLPPWCDSLDFSDVAIIFYAHLLSPFNFQQEIVSNFPNLWKAEIEFPLARMRSTNTDEASKRAWMKEYPDILYQVVEFTPTGDHAYITTEDAMGIHGYKCGRTQCATKATEGAHVIRMTEWPKYRVGRAMIICPCCHIEMFIGRTVEAPGVLKFSRAAFGFPIFDLWDSPQRQFGNQAFVDRILALTQAEAPLPDHVSRYLKFLQLMKENKCTLVPTLDIDLLWHTHQLSPVAYEKYCKKYLGRRINHVDTIRAMMRSMGQDDTARLWATRYGESYFDPENTAKSTEIKRGKATWKEAKQSVKLALRLRKLRYYRQPHCQLLRGREDTRQSLMEERTYKWHEAETLEGEGRGLLGEQERLNKKWEEAEKRRRLLEERLAAQVASATEAIWQGNADGTDKHNDQHQQQYQEDRYNGSWYSIVPSEVQSYEEEEEEVVVEEEVDVVQEQHMTQQEDAAAAAAAAAEDVEEGVEVVVKA